MIIILLHTAADTFQIRRKSFAFGNKNLFYVSRFPLLCFYLYHILLLLTSGLIQLESAIFRIKCQLIGNFVDYAAMLALPKRSVCQKSGNRNFPGLPVKIPVTADKIRSEYLLFNDYVLYTSTHCHKIDAFIHNRTGSSTILLLLPIIIYKAVRA